MCIRAKFVCINCRSQRNETEVCHDPIQSLMLMRNAQSTSKHAKMLRRENPATSAPSHKSETRRNVAQTCLQLKEMGPSGSPINVISPILVVARVNQMVSVHVINQIQKWGQRSPAPFRIGNGAAQARAPVC